MRRARRSILRRFAGDESGSMIVETVIVMPLLFWAFAACYVFFDAFRAETIHDRTSYTIADALSRQTQFVNGNFIDGLYELGLLLSEARGSSQLRVSVVRWDADDNRNYLVWSQVRGAGGMQALTDADLSPQGPVAEKIPMAADDDRVILVETVAGYRPIADVGIEPFDMTAFTAMRPRYAAKRICYDPVGDEDIADALC